MSKDGLPLEAPPAYDQTPPPMSYPPLPTQDLPKVNNIHIISDGSQQEEQTIVITSSSVLNLGHKPIDIICPYCQANIKTSIKHKANTKTHLYGFLLCLLGGLVCCMIPYCLPKCQTTNHHCPNCKNFLGSYPIAQ